MPITPDEFLTNQFDDAFAAAVREHHDDKDTPNYDEAHLSLDEMASIPGLPITTYHLPEGTYAESTTSPTLRVSIIDAFHKAIGDKNTELVQAMVQRGIVSPDVPDINGKTPLADAVRAENLFMAKLLLDLGADVNLPEQRRTRLPLWREKKYSSCPPELNRTPLMLCAEGGHLAMLRLLMDAEADDSVIAPDGQIALRLASAAGHRNLVDALPSRRGGEWRRWKHHSEKAVHHAKMTGYGIYIFVKFFAWSLPKFFIWDLPKPLAKAIGRSLMDTGQALGRLGVKIGREMIRLPHHLKVAGEHLLVGLKRLPDALVRAGTALAALLKKLSLAVWQMIKATPHWVGKQVKAAAKAGRWCGRKIAAAPGAMWRTSKAFAKWTKRRAKDMAAFMLDIGRWLWRCIRAIPSALVIVGNWLKTSTTAIGRALTSLLAQPIALLHTAAMAVISLISRARNVTFRDLLNAFTALISAIIDLPRQIWGALRALHKVALEVVEKVFGGVGVIVYWIVWLIVQAAIFVPRKLGVILLVAGSSIKKGAHEVAVLINPKF
ncbi:uncharacterized protein CcaverHIS019_0206920 [Cutaneotrichosporon cavernicola]|uniref:Ankyrin n=1 Tax=Cutaneotrichosporon cavernicola TaxID=279322 RepID=A0AA48L1B1_9TREE|nr:uncharacterized protein CcaverHIS019_0206920 [Cutaneotrichosporon cavernicola]BEI89330.1 hypothetical protein CcaverHIS019_0206920 [Cutaneotrichosporon cavernicola]